MAHHVYDWVRRRGYALGYAAAEAQPTHLLLDGGKWRIPDEAHGALINAYAASLARCPDRRPCVVELRTPVFRMFCDLDTRFATEEHALRAKRGGIEPVLRRVCAAVAPGQAALVCSASSPKREAADEHKMGFHVVWPEVLVSARTASELRDRIIAALHADPPPTTDLGIVGSWETIVDGTVYKSSGLRLPWSAKSKGDDRFYELSFSVGPDGAFAPQRAGTVSEVRQALLRLSIRVFDASPTIELGPAAGGAGDTDEPEERHWTSKSIAAYADVLPRLAACLPVQFMGQRFTSVLEAEHCYMLRSTARYCFNLGRAHRTNNVYFMLTKRGVCQRCYCRCETAEGRKYGMCKDYTSEVWPVPREVLSVFFTDERDAKRCKINPGGGGGGGGGETPAASSVGAMPSRAGKSFLDFDRLVARSRPALSPAANRPRRRA